MNFYFFQNFSKSTFLGDIFPSHTDRQTDRRKIVLYSCSSQLKISKFHLFVFVFISRRMQRANCSIYWLFDTYLAQIIGCNYNFRCLKTTRNSLFWPLFGQKMPKIANNKWFFHIFSPFGLLALATHGLWLFSCVRFWVSCFWKLQDQNLVKSQIWPQPPNLQLAFMIRNLLRMFNLHKLSILCKKKILHFSSFLP